MVVQLSEALVFIKGWPAFFEFARLLVAGTFFLLFFFFFSLFTSLVIPSPFLRLVVDHGLGMSCERCLEVQGLKRNDLEHPFFFGDFVYFFLERISFTSLL